MAKQNQEIEDDTPRTPRRTGSMIEQDIKMMHKPIIEQDELSKSREKIYIQTIERLIAGVNKSIGPDQSEALIAIRKEFFRREATIGLTLKTLHNLE